MIIFAPAYEHLSELWCNGNTADFGSVVLGSSPGSSTHKGTFSGAFVVFVIGGDDCVINKNKE